MVVKSVIEALLELYDMVMASEPVIDAFFSNIQFTVWIQYLTRFHDVIPDGGLAKKIFFKIIIIIIVITFSIISIPNSI